MREERHQLFTPPDKASDRGRREEGRKEKERGEKKSWREKERKVYRVLQEVN